MLTAAALSFAPSALAAGTLAPRQQSSCANAAPPAPVDTSEVPKPGAQAPPPLEVPAAPVGGERLTGCDVVTPQGAPPVPSDVSSGTWVLADLDSGDVLAAKDPHGRERPASTIKLLTALLATRELKMDDTLVASQEDADQEGSRAGLVPNVTYTVRQVLTGLIMRSGNDAAHALAMRMGGVDVTVQKMNALAHNLGGLDTRVATPSGLDGPGMSTSAYDLALFFRTGMRNPDFAAALATKQTQIPGAPGQPPVELVSDNQVLQTYPGALGGKSGFTDDAKHTFVASAERNGRRLVAALRWGETRQSQQAMRLLDYGFGLDRVQPLGGLLREETRTAPPKPPVAQAPQAPNPANPPQRSGWFGTMGGPLALLAAVGLGLIGLITFRQRRAKLAAAARRNNGDSADDHP